MPSTPVRRHPVVLRILLAAAVVAWAGCGDAFTLPPASLETTEVTVTLYALTGTPIGTPSAYNLLTLAAVRTDRTSDFDFAFDIGPDSSFGVGTAGATVAVLLPRGAIGLGEDGGLQVSSLPLDSILLAPEHGYEEGAGVAIDSGAVIIAASRKQNCNFGFVRPRYAKLRVEALDIVQRSVTLRLVVDPNCGYRGLGPGVPQQ